LFAVVFLLTLSLSLNLALAAKPPKTALDVTILSPQDGLAIEEGELFSVSGSVLAKRGDAGSVETFVQYSFGEGSSDFTNVDGTYLEIISGVQPQMADLFQDETYGVSWSLIGVPGTYEIRIFSQGETAKSGSSESRTVTITHPSIPGIELVDTEYICPEVGYGSTTGTYSDTFESDNVYEVLTEGINKQTAKSPGDDTSELGWIFEFNGLSSRQDTKLYIECHADFPNRDAYFEGFSVQVEYQGTWYDIVSPTDETTDKMYSAELPDDECQSIRVRVIDHDRTVGDRVRSLFYIDQLYLDTTGTQVINHGYELLFGGGLDDLTVSAFELTDGAWYYDRTFPVKHFGYGDHTGYTNVDEIIVVDVDGDGMNETITGGQYIQIFDWINGAMIPTHTIAPPGTRQQTVKSIVAADLDGDQGDHLELLVTTLNWDIHSAVFKWIDGGYVPIFTISSEYRREVGGCIGAVGDVDGDSDPEFIVVEEFPTSNIDPGLLLLRLFDYQVDTWIEIADYALELGVQNWIDNVQILDLDSDGANEIFLHHRNNPSKILEYSNGQLVKTWEAPMFAMSARVGDVLNNGKIQIVAAGLISTDPGVGFNVYEYVDGTFTNTINFSGPAHQGCLHDAIKLGDIDQDGHKEMVFVYYTDYTFQPSMFAIFRNGELLFTADTGYQGCQIVAIGDYDTDAI